MELPMSIDGDARTIENETLVLDLVEWIARQPRPYADVMEAWRTSCPRFPIWEDTVDLGFVTRVHEGRRELIQVTPSGQAFLRSRGRLLRNGPSS
jgi:hypothetical protein